MKKILTVLAPATAYLTLASFSYAAAIGGCATGDFSILCGFTGASVGNIITTVINLIFVVATIAALLYLVLGGLRWLTSGGDKQAVSSARDSIVAAIIGLVIIFLSYLILNVILFLFIGKNLSQLTMPSLTP